MKLGIEGKTALVMGGSGGLGLATAKALAAEGARVVLAGRNADKVEAIVAQLIADGHQAMAAIWDQTDSSAMAHQIDAIEARFGNVDILFNNTGGPPPSPAAGQDMAVWSQFFEQMVLSVIALTDRVLPGMRACNWGRIITTTSSGVISPIPNLALSNTLRSALVTWSKTLAAEVARHGITSNIVVPGRIATDRVAFLDSARAERLGRPVEDVTAESTATIPIGRYGRPEEYGAVVAFLASGAASYVTGTMIRVDGGMIANV